MESGHVLFCLFTGFLNDCKRVTLESKSIIGQINCSFALILILRFYLVGYGLQFGCKKSDSMQKKLIYMLGLMYGDN